jgi:hypothetical protein
MFLSLLLYLLNFSHLSLFLLSSPMEKGVAGKSSGAVAGEPSRRRRRTGKKMSPFFKKNSLFLFYSLPSTHFQQL